MLSTIIREHASGTAIIRTRQLPGLLMIKPSIVLAYEIDPGLKLENRNFIYSRAILCMPVYRSPLLTFGKWISKYTDSLSILSRLRSIQKCYLENPPSEDADECFKEAYEAFKANITKLDTALFKVDLDAFYKQYSEPSEEACTWLVVRLEKHTIDIINAFEQCIYDMFVYSVPVEDILTPHLTPDLTEMLPDEQQNVLAKQDTLFLAKDVIQNERLVHGGQSKQFYFNPEISAGLKYKNYLDQQRITEYFAFLNINKND